MRTTVSLDENVYEQVRRLAFESKRTLGDVLNELLIEGLKARNAPMQKRELGQLRGSISIADDFDETPSEIIEALGETV